MIEFAENEIKYLAYELPDEIRHFKYNGDFDGERRAIAAYLKRDLTAGMRRRLELEDVIADTMRGEYPTGFEALLARVREKYPACRAENLEHIISLGNADYIRRGGERYFHRAAARNILNCNSRYLASLESGIEPPASVSTARHENARIMRERGGRAYEYRIQEWLEPEEGFRRPGKTLRVHLPYPCECTEQSNITLISSSHPVYISDAAHRTAFFNEEYREGERYSVEFSYVIRMKYRLPDAAAVSTDQPGFYTGEQYPQIRFTPHIKELAADLKSGETNPLILARRAYDYVTRHVVYSYMRHYLCFDFIPGFALDNGRGDCGVMALLFITLCRAMGVPARWQSGSHVCPDSIGSHDWAQFYAAPYGWLYCDPSFGGGALRSGDDELWNHYFGNLDVFREINCTEFQSQFDPPKKYLRCDPYDNQCGEAEYEDLGLGFDGFDCGRCVVASREIEI